MIVLDVRIPASLPHLEWKNRIIRPKEVQNKLIAGGVGKPENSTSDWQISLIPRKTSLELP